jgi:hypothetical protein
VSARSSWFHRKPNHSVWVATTRSTPIHLGADTTPSSGLGNPTNAGNTARSSLEPPPPRSTTRAPAPGESPQPPTPNCWGRFGLSGAPIRHKGGFWARFCLGFCRRRPRGPRGLLEQTRTVLVPVYGSGCPEFLATMRGTVAAPGLLVLP